MKDEHLQAVASMAAAHADRKTHEGLPLSQEDETALKAIQNELTATAVDRLTNERTWLQRFGTVVLVYLMLLGGSIVFGFMLGALAIDPSEMFWNLYSLGASLFMLAVTVRAYRGAGFWQGAGAWVALNFGVVFVVALIGATLS
jgi:hypothetical protein